MATALPRLPLRIILDVGANTGQSALAFLDWFDAAEVHCFEPVPQTFHELAARFGHEPRVRCSALAMSSRSGTGSMQFDSQSVLASLVQQPQEPLPNHVLVNLDTIDAYCRREGIQEINLLKIDTEGHDLEVLRGSALLLKEQRIDLVQVEAGMHPGNQVHVPFRVLQDYLEGHGYLLFAIYEQCPEWTRGEPHLRRTNPVFVSSRVITAHRAVVA